jgi:hypothetical protein
MLAVELLQSRINTLNDAKLDAPTDIKPLIQKDIDATQSAKDEIFKA